MKIQVLSDLHVGRGTFEPAPTDADLFVVAGDVSRPARAVAWAAALGKPVLYVLGNHEFYGGSLDGTVREFRQLAAGTRVRLLDCEQALIEGVRFIGCTLWSDFRLLGDGPARDAAIAMAMAQVYDFSRIRVEDAGNRLFSPGDSQVLFDRHAAWLETQLAMPHDGPTVVITHHGPTPLSISPRYPDSPLNPCFVSDASRLMNGDRVGLWIHGHLHDSFDYELNGTRVLCNPRGYVVDGVVENPTFDPGLIVEV